MRRSCTNVWKSARSNDKIRLSLAAERGSWPSGLAGDAPTTPEYVALAQILGCRLVTLDGRLRRGAAQLGMVIGVHELAQPTETTESGSRSSELSEDDTRTAGDG